MIDINKVRKDTPNCIDKLFFDSAGSSLMPICVRERIDEYLKEEEREGGYTVHRNRLDDLEKFYPNTAQLINAKPRNIAFTHDATHAYAKALSSIPFSQGDVILTTDDDYVSNYLNFISMQKRMGIQVARVKNLENGDLDLADFEDKVISLKPKLVSVTHIPTNSGLIQNVKRVGEICKKQDTIFLLDACQSVGQIPIDVQALGCDFMSVTGRKFLRGPRGTGFLYVSDRILERELTPLYIDLQGATWVNSDTFTMVDTARRFETWESPYALIMGLNEAIKYALNVGMSSIKANNDRLCTLLRSNLNNIPGVAQFDKGTSKGSLITFKKKDLTKEQTIKFLNDHSVYYSMSTREGALIDYDKKKVDWCIRISPHYFNTKAEIEHLSELIESM